MTIKGPEQSVEIKVVGDAPNFENVKAGDAVYMNITEKLAVSITK